MLKKSSAVFVAALTLMTLLSPGAAVGQNPHVGGLSVPVQGVATDGTAVSGTFRIVKFVKSDVPTAPVNAIGTIVLATADGNVRVTQVSVPVAFGRSSGVAAAGATIQQVACDVLTLDIGAIHLDLLGLVVDLSPVHLEINAVPGAGNLLGNLLCAIVGLLDPSGLISNLTRFINALNELLRLLNGLGL